MVTSRYAELVEPGKLVIKEEQLTFDEIPKSDPSSEEPSSTPEQSDPIPEDESDATPLTDTTDDA